MLLYFVVYLSEFQQSIFEYLSIDNVCRLTLKNIFIPQLKKIFLERTHNYALFIPKCTHDITLNIKKNKTIQPQNYNPGPGQYENP